MGKTTKKNKQPIPTITVPKSLPVFVFVLSLVFCLAAFMKGWSGTICEAYGFRQTQTAITVRYLLEGGPWLAYHTPVLGPPWSIPMEFPLFQWLVVLVVKIGMFPIDQAGRFVSILFFLATLLPVYKILEALRVSKNNIFLILSLYCLSPDYLYWSRTFMIESLALALSLFYLWMVILYFREENIPQKKMALLLGIGAIGILGALVKITTFFAFAACAGLFWIHSAFFKPSPDRASLIRRMEIWFLVAAFILPFIALLQWTSYADALKNMNPIGSHLTSTALKDWNFGTAAQKFSLDTWKIFYVRDIKYLLGNPWLLPLSLLVSAFARPQRIQLIGLSFFLFVLPFFVFTNLLFVHTYYVYSNGIFLIIAVGIMIASLWDSSTVPKQVAGIALYCLIAFFSVSTYFTDYWPAQGHGFSIADMTQDISQFTQKDDVVVIFGEDFSSEIPYYIQRRALMIPYWMPHDFQAPYFKQMKHNLEHYKIGAVAFGSGSNVLNRDFVRLALAEFNMHDNGYKLYQKDGRPVVVFYK